MKLMKCKPLFCAALCTLVLCITCTTAFATEASAYYNEEEAEATETVTETDGDAVIDRSGTEETEDTTEADSESNPFTTAGNGTLQDVATSDQNKLFYTVTTANGNTFFLIIDGDSTSDNVYMLSMIDEADLADFIEEDETDSTSTDYSYVTDGTSDTDATEDNSLLTTTEDETDTETEETETDAVAESSGGNSYLGYILLAILAVGAVGAYYVLKIRPRREENDTDDETAYGGEEEPDTPTLIEASDEDADVDDAEPDEDEDDADTSDDVDTGSGVPLQDYPDYDEEDDGTSPDADDSDDDTTE